MGDLFIKVRNLFRAGNRHFQLVRTDISSTIEVPGNCVPAPLRLCVKKNQRQVAEMQ